MAQPEPLEPVLLTGAGFTKNFGGFLADDMRAMILDHSEVTNSSSLQTHLKNNLDYESVYVKVVYDQSRNDKSALINAVTQAYEKLDNGN